METVLGGLVGNLAELNHTVLLLHVGGDILGSGLSLIELLRGIHGDGSLLDVLVGRFA